MVQRTRHVRPVLFVRTRPSGRHHAAQLPEVPAEPDARRRRAARSAAVDILRDRERGVPRYNQFRRLLHKEPVKSFEELTDNAVWRERDSQGLRQRSREGRPDDRPLRRAAAGRVRLQRDRLPHLRPDGVATAEERPLLHRRLPRGALHRIRTELHQRELDADGAEASLSRAGPGPSRRGQRVQAVAKRQLEVYMPRNKA